MLGKHERLHFDRVIDGSILASQRSSSSLSFSAGPFLLSKLTFGNSFRVTGVTVST